MDKPEPGKILITGASGLVGRFLITQILKKGVWSVVALSRQARQTEHPLLKWEILPDRPEDLTALLENSEVVINLAGENIGSGRWTPAKKKNIADSRVGFTDRLSRSILNCVSKPRVYIQASATGFYGHSDDIQDESSPRGNGYLSRLCQNWENASIPLETAGITRVICRFGIVLSSRGGILSRMAPPVRYGFGTILGSGRQWTSWIHAEDLVGALITLMESRSGSAVYNICSPQAVMHQEFMCTLAGVLHRPLPWRIPASLLRLTLGEMADELLLASARIFPEKLINLGYRFTYPELSSALESIYKPLR